VGEVDRKKSRKNKGIAMMVIKDNYTGNEPCEECKGISTLRLTDWNAQNGVMKLKYFCNKCFDKEKGLKNGKIAEDMQTATMPRVSI
jgi:hypothetical protein